MGGQQPHPPWGLACLADHTHEALSSERKRGSRLMLWSCTATPGSHKHKCSRGILMRRQAGATSALGRCGTSSNRSIHHQGGPAGRDGPSRAWCGRAHRRDSSVPRRLLFRLQLPAEVVRGGVVGQQRVPMLLGAAASARHPHPLGCGNRPPTKAGYVKTHTHAHDAYTELSAILTRTSAGLAAQLAAGGSDFCCEALKGVGTCDCIAVVADEAVDMFVGEIARVGTPMPFLCQQSAVVPIASTDALSNIAGALLFKGTKQTYTTARGVSDDDQSTCVAFVAVHSRAAERGAACRPADNVVSIQYSVNSLTLVSASLY